ncbi:SDR family oxidoreductase [Shewanella sp. SR43-4]|jgi:NAD(P)-dependent dehydrogenase (short-subunit alcohol dehydrogenase family)|uniref:SDR family oxidoreductase n=1 Tax=Shewanella vesiculosa TaxID=518738 RepID=A0ABV0FQQ5_9GAMM|nr:MULTISPECIES: SDR family oxidoreductase [Shewanella]NCQ46028.1 SDR family oxidoreductase [Shewanella frigidimarina]MBB1317116.1 SDR family oxidoreductase [Shewanella sp. SR43-4]MBB1321996.1 SDR family oxidoreductase [Shewanella sp. SR43-8]MBB1476287.1 SDR family oxidoreductase [Shewanella sp. SG41-3]NCO70486.1 SDR family oxidoreductase [Shewanella vesiculosa]|tara:strand:+ start:9092 stop:9919 length:828 start_codon:yes stop_codon:yes gene_type:complete
MSDNTRFDYTAKNVVVVGGTSGINLQVAIQFAKAGANVTVASRSVDKVNAAVELLNQANPNAIHLGVSFDVRDNDALTLGFDKIASTYGHIDVLISGAAGNFPASAAKLSPNGFKSVIDIDLIGSFQVLKHAYPLLSRPNGSIIQISAPQAYIAMPLQVHVCAAKAGVDMLTRTLALEWGVEGIRINSIVPGPIADTEGFNRLAPTDELQQRVANSVPLKRNGQGQDIANAALFLASDMASYITGVVLPVDGGWSLGGASIAMTELGDIAAKHGL